MDKMLALSGNQEKFRKDLQDEFNKGPLKFRKKYVMPVLPSLARDPELEEKLAYTNEERLQEIENNLL